MKLNFSINFRTEFGQSLFITGEILPTINSQNTPYPEIEKICLAMDYTTDGQWTTTFDIPTDKILAYKYMIQGKDAANIYEVGDKRYLKIMDKAQVVNIFDQWQGYTELSPLLSKPFTEVLFKHKGKDYHSIGGVKNELSIVATIPCINKEQSIYICGNIKELGLWDIDKAIKMKPLPGSKWGVNLKCTNKGTNIEYKFLIKDNKSSEFTWEDGDNRLISSSVINSDEGYLFEHSEANFKAIYPKFTGTAIPIFSIRTKNSGGVGEFLDLKKMAHWASKLGQSFIQILPINDTYSTGTWTDSYPYSAISIFALHSIYLNLEAIGGFSEDSITKSYREEKKILNALEMIDYERVMSFKAKYLSILFEEHKDKTFKEAEYQDFYKKNSDWLLPYCSFCVLRDKYKTANFHKWGKDAEYSDLITKRLEKKEGKKQFELILFTQYHLHKQLKEAVAYAHKKGIVLKGDIPIGITPHSVEAWVEPRYFRMDSQAGAPPDAFAVDGQNWGFPTYNWEKMEEDGYKWWKKRFTKMGEYFDAYRIDHVLGFFRIWEIPISQTRGLLGYFNPALPYSADEISRYGLGFDYARFVKPYINYSILKDLFNDRADYVAENFLSPKNYGFYEFKSNFDDQRKIEEYFASGTKSEDLDLKDKLQSLISEVLFIEDPHKKGMFHPRISAQYTYSYKDLSYEAKSCFNTIYNEFFYHRNNSYWKEQAIKKLPELISATNMLTCAEDLGMIPACVPETLSNLRISTLEIQRMPKDPNERFSSPYKYPYLSVATTGTHDTSTLRAWWEEDKNVTQDYYNSILGEYGTAPQFCEPEICKKIIKSHIDGGSMLTILPIQDWLSIDPKIRKSNPNSERINIPANPKHYWRFRIHINIEDLIKNDELNTMIQSMSTSENF